MGAATVGHAAGNAHASYRTHPQKEVPAPRAVCRATAFNCHSPPQPRHWSSRSTRLGARFVLAVCRPSCIVRVPREPLLHPRTDRTLAVRPRPAARQDQCTTLTAIGGCCYSPARRRSSWAARSFAMARGGPSADRRRTTCPAWFLRLNRKNASRLWPSRPSGPRRRTWSESRANWPPNSALKTIR